MIARIQYGTGLVEIKIDRVAIVCKMVISMVG